MSHLDQPPVEVSATDRSPDVHVPLDIGGMTCGACSARIERKLNKLDGVAAVVNYATERASVTLNGSVSVDEVVIRWNRLLFGTSHRIEPIGRVGCQQRYSGQQREVVGGGCSCR